MSASDEVNFGKVASDYARFRDELPDTIFEQLGLRNIHFVGKSVIDLGSGTGIFSRAMARKGAIVTGVEPEFSLIQEAKLQDQQRRQQYGIQYLQGQAEDIRLPDHQYDMITALRAWHWFDRIQVLQEARRLLRKNGYLIVIHSIFLPQGSDIVKRTLEILQRCGVQLKPAGSMAEGKTRRTGLPAQWFGEWEAYGFQIIDEWQHLYDLSFTLDDWCGKVRSLSWMTNVDELTKQRVMESIQGEFKNVPGPYSIPHQYSVVVLKAEHAD